MTGDLQMLEELGWGCIGRCSPKAPIPKGWPNAPPAAAKVCWAYPLADTAQPKKSARSMLCFLKLFSSKELSFAIRGGFLLLSAEDEAQLRPRMQEVTLPHLRKAGATKFCWVNPKEKLGGTSTAPEHGGFAYLLQGQDPVFFPVKEILHAG